MSGAPKSKVKIEHPIYKKGNIRITQEDLFLNPNINYDYVHTDEDNNIVDNLHPDIKYFYEYKNKHIHCEGESYYVIGTFLVFNKKENVRNIMVVVQMLPTHTILKIPYITFQSEEIFDPYYKYLYNGNCCIGNVNTYNNNDYARDLAFWHTYMGRLFDPNHFDYKYFGGCGLRPLFIEWVCFENYLLYNKLRINNGLIPITDPNDYHLYYKPPTLHNGGYGTPTDEQRMINAFPVYEHSSYITTPRFIKDVPFEERHMEVLNNRARAGRPAGSTNKPKEKKLMFRVIKPNADLKYDQSLIV